MMPTSMRMNARARLEDCECVEDAEDCYHITTEIGEEQ
jgi:hypothetical protein